MARLSRNAEVLRYLLEIAPRLGHTQLAKFAYLGDLLARQCLGRPISEMEYRFDNYGPFDAVGFYQARDELIEGGYIRHERADIGGYAGFEMRPTDVPVEYHLGDAEVEILRWVAQKYAALTATELCNRVVYTSPPMRNATPGRHLDMEQMDRKPEELEFSLERMLAGEESADEGRVRPLADVLNELHARYHG